MNTVFLATTLVSFVFNFFILAIYFLHMFQLNSYKPHEQKKWLKDNFAPAIIGKNLTSVIAFVALFFGLAGKIVATLFFVSGGFLNLPKKAKKPLVYTNRVKRMIITLAVLVALMITAVTLAKIFWVLPVILVATPYIVLLANLINRPVETSINNYYINDAKKMIAQSPDLKVIGVTGSYGKTSVKFFLKKLLSAKYNVLMTPESFNTTLGVVKTIRTSLKATHEFFICEMGAKNVGDIKEICDIVNPDFGVITSIGPQHLESFKTIENVILTKFELADATDKNGIVFLNNDNEYIRSQTVLQKCVRYGIDSDDSDYKPFDITVSDKGSTFKMIIDKTEHTFTTRLIGAHNVLNIAGAVAVAHTLGVPVDDLIYQTRLLESVPHRLQLIKGNKALIIDDAYNSNPSGAKAALDTLAQFNGMKILVTPGMIELGEKQDECNFNFGVQAADVCDYIVLVGEKQTKSIYEGILSTGYDKEKVIVATNLNNALKSVENIKSGDLQKIVLLENDLPDNY